MVALLVAGGSFYLYQNSRGETNPVNVLHAGSLTKPFSRINEINESLDIRNESHGSVEVSRLISKGQKNPDIAAVSDYSLIPDFMMTEKLTEWYIKFARNEVVLCYTDNSKYSDEIDKNNWYKILARPDVKFGFGNPNADPGGYRAMMTIQLAELYYDNSRIFDGLIAGNTSMRAPENEDNSYVIEAEFFDELDPTEKVVPAPKEVGVIPKLEEESIDYMFNYKSIAKQHDFNFVKLPAQVNLGKVEYEDLYSQVKIKLTGGNVKEGKPIVYGITILKNANHKESAVDFLKYLFSKQGREIFENVGLTPIYPPRTNDVGVLPSVLQDIVVE